MAGRNSKFDKSERREQASKQTRGNARGHAKHHRQDGARGAPRGIATGKDRTMDTQRRAGYSQLLDDTLADLNAGERNSEVERRIQTKGEAGKFGVDLEGQRASGVVVEVRRGNFLTRIDSPAPGEGNPIPKILRCILRGTMQQFDLGLTSLVAPGDSVELMVPKQADPGTLHQIDMHGILLHVAPRRSEFRRLHPSGRAIQTLAANADGVVLVTSCAEPDFRPGFADRVMVCAASSSLPMALVINKIDMGLPEKDRLLLDVYRSLGVAVFETSTTDAALGAAGIDALKNWINGLRCVLTGHSGVGKSSLMLALDVSLNATDIRTGEVSSQTGKGTHTTTHGRLFDVDLGDGRRAELIDTPGVREFTPADTDKQNLWGWFPEIAKLQGQCTYSDCKHLNEKGCAVLAAVQSGAIHPRRHLSYVRIYETLPQ